MSEFGLVTVVSALLYRICSFELLTSSQHGEIYATYSEKMGLSLDVLDGIVKTRMGEQAAGLAPDSSAHCAKSLLDSAFYHLYASIPLSVMKKLLWSPVTPRDADILRLSSEASSPDLYKAFICAAEGLRYDCRLGLSYLRKMAPIKFGPEDAVGAYEGGMLYESFDFLLQWLTDILYRSPPVLVPLFCAESPTTDRVTLNAQRTAQ